MARIANEWSTTRRLLREKRLRRRLRRLGRDLLLIEEPRRLHVTPYSIERTAPPELLAYALVDLDAVEAWIDAQARPHAPASAA